MQTHTPITLESKPALSWTALARPAVERSRRWYVGAAIVVCAIVAYALLTGAWTLAIVTVIAGAMYPLIHGHRPPSATIELHDSGILYNNDFIRWDQLAGFWFLETPAYTELRFVPKSKGRSLAIQTDSLDPANLRMILGQRLPELKNKRESLIDTFIRICKL